MEHDEPAYVVKISRRNEQVGERYHMTP
jgi:hypothetical protein